MILSETGSEDREKQGREKLLRAGSIASKALSYAKTIIKPGVHVSKVTLDIENFIKRYAELAFPVQISVNNVAAHYYPSPMESVDIELKSGDVIKVDLGVSVEGFIADTAITIVFDNDTGFLLKKSSENALKHAINLVKPGVSVSDIGAMITEEITAMGFKPVRNLSGHGLGLYNVHTDPTIPNYNNHSNRVLQEGEVIAIEPFSTNGVGLVKEHGEPQVFMINKTRILNLRTHQARAVMSFIKEFKGLPFAKPWLYNKFSKYDINIAFREFRLKNTLEGYSPLKEINNGLVAQEEHTIIVMDKPIVTTMRNDE